MEAQETALAGRYHLLDVLGDGGMARVYRAEDSRLCRTVAIKMLHPEYQREPEFVRRFGQEAQLAGSLSHPHITSIFDVDADDGRPFIVMEYVAGGSLKSLLMQQSSLPLDQVMAIVAQLGQALDAAHSHGIVHRDVKPENILLTTDRQIKVSDFGIARALAASSANTTTGVVLGSVTYLSPEQAQGRPVTAESDLYSLGVVLYELLTGRPPFRGDNPLATALLHLTQQPIPPSIVRPSLPAQLDGVVLRALSKDPHQRFHSGAALVDALRTAAGAEPQYGARVPLPRADTSASIRNGTLARGSRRPVSQLESDASLPYGPRSRTGSWSPPTMGQRSQGQLALVLTLLLALLGIGGAFITTHLPPRVTLAASSGAGAALPATATATAPLRTQHRPAPVLYTPYSAPVRSALAEERQAQPISMPDLMIAAHQPVRFQPISRITAVLPTPPPGPAAANKHPQDRTVISAARVDLSIAHGIGYGFAPYNPTDHFEAGTAAAYVIAHWNGVRRDQAITFTWTTPGHNTGTYTGCASWWSVCYTQVPLVELGRYRVTFAVAGKALAHRDFSVSTATGQSARQSVP